MLDSTFPDAKRQTSKCWGRVANVEGATRDKDGSGAVRLGLRSGSWLLTKI